MAGDSEIYCWRELLAEGEKRLREGSSSYTSREVDPEALTVILFTSGTTGNPKGVMLNHRNITSNIMDVCRIAHILESDKTLSILPIHHTYECTLGMLLVLYRGASTAFCEGLKYIVQNMKEAQNTVFIAVPLMLEMIYSRIWKQAEKQGKDKMLRKAIRINNRFKSIGIDMSRKLFSQVYKELGGKLRMVITGAAALSPNIYRGFEDLVHYRASGLRYDGVYASDFRDAAERERTLSQSGIRRCSGKSGPSPDRRQGRKRHR